MQSSRAHRYVRMVAMGKPQDHDKLLSWMCTTLVHANPDSRAFVELEGCWFKRMVIAYGASLNGFILIRRKTLFMDGAQLGRPYGGTLFGVVALGH